jgi:hypothetical protein
MLVDALLIHYLIEYQTNHVEQFLEIGEKPFEIEPLYFTLSKDVEGADEIMEEFNAEIIDMIKDGTYHDILELNWVRADIDGDGVTEIVLDGEHAGQNAPLDSYAIHPDESVSHEDSKYHVDGHTYDSWDKVPEKFKISLESSQTENKGGLTINFGK